MSVSEDQLNQEDQQVKETICFVCRYHRNVAPAGSSSCRDEWYYQKCFHPDVARPCGNDPVTGKKRFMAKNDLGTTYYTDEEFPPCRNINSFGECELFEEKSKEDQLEFHATEPETGIINMGHSSMMEIAQELGSFRLAYNLARSMEIISESDKANSRDWAALSKGLYRYARKGRFTRFF